MNSMIACILSSYLVFTQAATNNTIDITVYPEFPVVGQNISLRPKNTSENITACLWSKGEAKTYVEILVYQLSTPPQIIKKSGYDVRHVPKNDCSLRINNVSMADIGMYGLQRNTTNGTTSGKIYLVVIKDNKDANKRKGLSSGSIAGIFVGCLVGTAAVVGLVSYQVWKDSSKR
ncbi:uncharacterized protein PHA67_003382 isoform 1-T1 [Liasis olivaceus]